LHTCYASSFVFYELIEMEKQIPPEPYTAVGLKAKDNKVSLAQFDEHYKRLSSNAEQSSLYVFTDIRLAQKYLGELHALLKQMSYPDFELVFHLNTALVENQLYNYTLSERHFQAAIEILNERGDVSQLAEAYIDYAGTLLNLEQIDKVEQYLDQAAKFLNTFPEKRLEARLICRRGFLYQKNSNRPKALQAFLEATDKFKSNRKSLKQKDYYFLTLALSGLGTIYAQNNELKKSVDAYLEVLDICERTGMRSRLSWHYLNVGKGYLGIHEEEKAIAYFRDAIKVIDDVNQQARALALANLGYCFLRGGMHAKALELFDRAYPLFKDKRDKNLANIEWWKGRVYEVQKRKKKALRHYFKALEHAKNGEDYKQITGVLREIANWYANEEDYKNAFDYQRYYENAIEKYLQQVKASEIRELEVKYEAERKEKEAEMFKLQATGLQLKALRAQMNPHFVFNALNSVQNFITSNDNTLAAKYLAQFAHLMRQSLEYSELEIISLEKEIEFLKNYLEINQNLRFENKMSHSLEVDEDIEEDIFGVPTMIIQPYIENAIEHGIRSKKKGHILVKFELADENTILCIVEDNGVGRKRARELQMENPNFKDHRSLGTKITYERLDILNKSKGHLKREVVKIIDLSDEKTGKASGTRVEVLIPVMEIQMK